MEDELYALLRETCGEKAAAKIWDAFEKRIDGRCKMLEGAIEGWRKSNKDLQRKYKHLNDEKTILVMRNSALQDVIVRHERDQEIEECFEAAERDRPLGLFDASSKDREGK